MFRSGLALICGAPQRALALLQQLMQERFGLQGTVSVLGMDEHGCMLYDLAVGDERLDGKAAFHIRDAVQALDGSIKLKAKAARDMGKHNFYCK